MKKTLVIDVGGSSIKFRLEGSAERFKVNSGPKFTPEDMVEKILDQIPKSDIARVSIGFPAPVEDNYILKDPKNLGKGWVGFDFKKAFGKEVRILNDAAMQAVGSYEGGKMLFLGLGTGLGSAIIYSDHLVPLELCELRYDKDTTVEEAVAKATLKKIGEKKWRKQVMEVVDVFYRSFLPDYIVIGGGNAKKLEDLPDYIRLGDNSLALIGGERLWAPDFHLTLSPTRQHAGKSS